MVAVVVLIHSPLVGPLTWSLVGDELRRRGVGAVVPTLADAEDDKPPFWRQHAAAVARGIEAIPAGTAIVLVGHSGAGPLLPVIGQRVSCPVAAYVFVDAGIPANGKSRLDLMAVENPALAGELRRHLTAGGRFPGWRGEDLRAAIPEPRLRRQMIEEMHPRSLAFFAEPIPVFAGWPDAPRGYLRLSSAYGDPAKRARQDAWAYREIDGGHFHMLVEPPAVADAILDLVEQLVGSAIATPGPKCPAAPGC